MDRDKEGFTFFSEGGAGTPCGTEKQRPVGQPGAKGGGSMTKKKAVRPVASEEWAMGEAPGFAYRALDQARGRGLGQS